jgi:hypothetical protein
MVVFIVNNNYYVKLETILEGNKRNSDRLTYIPLHFDDQRLMIF